MKTKFQVLAAVVAVAAFSNLVQAKERSHVEAILGSENPIGVMAPVSNDVTATSNTTDAVDNAQSTSGYHHSSSGSGDGAFSGNVINVGVGFISGEGNLYTGPGYTTSTGPAIEASYERAINSRFGIGLNFSWQSAKSSSTTTTVEYNPPTYQPQNVSYTETNTLSLIQIALRGAYHFNAGDKFDPYIGACFGYCTISDSYTTTETGGTNSSASLTGVEFGGFGGARYFFSDHIGVWAEIQYAVASFKVSVGSYSATASINPCTVVNLGLSFKF